MRYLRDWNAWNGRCIVCPSTIGRQRPAAPTRSRQQAPLGEVVHPLPPQVISYPYSCELLINISKPIEDSNRNELTRVQYHLDDYVR